MTYMTNTTDCHDAFPGSVLCTSTNSCRTCGGYLETPAQAPAAVEAAAQALAAETDEAGHDSVASYGDEIDENEAIDSAMTDAGIPAMSFLHLVGPVVARADEILAQIHDGDVAPRPTGPRHQCLVCTDDNGQPLGLAGTRCPNPNCRDGLLV